MRNLGVFCLLALLLAGCATMYELPGVKRAIEAGPDAFLARAVVGPQGDGTYVVPTTQVLNPAGTTVRFPGRPVDIAVHPNGRLLAIKNRTDVVFFDAVDCRVVQTLAMPAGGSAYCGIEWSADGMRVWTTAAEAAIHCAERGQDGAFAWVKTVPLPGPEGKGDSAPGGFALDETKRLIYVALSRNNSVGIVEAASGEIETEIPVGTAPYDVLLHSGKAYVTNWGGRRPRPDDRTGPSSGSRVVVDAAGIASTGTVSVIDLGSRKVTQEIEVDLHPCGMALSLDGDLLYVANANSDAISVIDTESDAVVERWLARPSKELPFGSAPNDIAISEDGKSLYVALGGNNCIAVMDAKNGAVRGLVPTGWYPGAVAFAQQGALLCIANTKGVGSRYPETNVERKGEVFGKEWHGFNSHDHMGSLTVVETPDNRTLDAYTHQAAVAMRLPHMLRESQSVGKGERVVAVPEQPGDVSPIKHVMYIIKENRTYDQVFGGLPQGKGDPTLCQFGREVTPNHHALAEEFVLLDNFYCNGVLSADGHQWTNEGYVTDYIEKAFGGFPRSYPYDGDDAIAYASSGFIWDHVLAAGLTFRNYGEMVKARITPGDATWTDIYQDYLNETETVKISAYTEVNGLEGYICPTFIGFPGKMQDVYRAREFLKEFRACEEKGEWYNFVIMLLPNDHTVGTREGYPTPRATVADNDLALGQIVEAVSKSQFWPETAIFVVEDDPQAGLDHVDGHRTVALCISPYTKRGEVISTHYNQSSMLRTMELIMGLPPMNQFDMAANPLYECFTETPDTTPYTCLPNQIPLDEMNPKLEALRGKQLYYAKKSMEMPLDDIDQADEGLFNRIIWHSVKGYDVPYPKLAHRETVGAAAWSTEELEEDD
jgi:YVTN family beta-propeller protein